MKIILNWLLQSVVIYLAANLIPGVFVNSFVTAVIVALALSILNLLVKPILSLLALPLTILTFGLFSLVINVIILLLAAALVPGFTIDSFTAGLIFGLALSVLNSLVDMIVGGSRSRLAY